MFGLGKRKRVGIFGGSFNPPHAGHTVMCKWLFDEGLIDELFVIPCFIHPFGKDLLPFDERVVMCRLAFYKLNYEIRVLDIERELGGTSYTLQTVEHLKEKHPRADFFLVTGEDVRTETHEWKEFEKVKGLAQIINVPRGKDSPIPDISSTEVRRRLAAGEAFANLVENEVAVFLVTRGLFRAGIPLKS